MNVLMLLVDQLAAQWLPAYGQRIVRAPRLSELARKGVVFDSAYCASPLCAPSRSAFITGRLPSRIDVFDNAAELPASIPTLAHRLRARGYYTCLAGKMHFVGPDQLHGFEERLTTDIYPADLDWTPDWRRPLSDRLPWYHTMESVLNPGVCTASMQMDFDQEVAFRGARALLDHARRRRRQPFFLVVSFTHPHDPWEIPPRYWDLYDPEEIAPPTVPAIPLAEADPHSQRLRQMCAIDEACLSEPQIRRARHAYFASISYVDERIGEVLDALCLSGLERDTLIVFTADHGEMLGERGLWYKMSFFEPSARVPLIFKLPGDPGGRRVASPVSLLDLPPTLLELTGGRDGHGSPPDMDGVSLAPLIAGGADDGKRAVFAEYLAEGVTAPALMVRKGRHKLILCDGDPDQLYDLAADPYELVNLAADPGGAEIARRLRAEAAMRWDPTTLAARVLASQRDRRLITRALREGAYAPWDYQPRIDASMQYVRNRADMYELQRLARLDLDGGPSAERARAAEVADTPGARGSSAAA